MGLKKNQSTYLIPQEILGIDLGSTLFYGQRETAKQLGRNVNAIANRIKASTIDYIRVNDRPFISEKTIQLEKNNYTINIFKITGPFCSIELDQESAVVPALKSMGNGKFEVFTKKEQRPNKKRKDRRVSEVIDLDNYRIFAKSKMKEKKLWRYVKILILESTEISKATCFECDEEKFQAIKKDFLKSSLTPEQAFLKHFSPPSAWCKDTN